MRSTGNKPAVTSMIPVASGPRENETMADVLRRSADERPEQCTFSFLADGEAQEDRFTNRELDARARAIAGMLKERELCGERVLLFYPPGLELIAAVFGCFYAGAVVILPWPPDPRRLDRTLPRLLSIVDDAQASALLTTSAMAEQSARTFADVPRLASLPRLTTDDADPEQAVRWPDHTGPDPSDLALLQYTSGSTDQPKGVMVTHANLITNLESQQAESGWDVEADSHAVIWLPPYHDMGLIGGVFLWLYAGATVTLMSPEAFMYRPDRWLRAVSRTKATHIGAPNFAYDLCARKLSPSERDSLDLGTLQVAWNGAETVRPETMKRFTETFQSRGFRREAFVPSYGLAEATLLVSATGRLGPTLPEWEGAASCGPPVRHQRVVIVDPEHRTPCEPGELGEVWVAGPCLAAGYWNRPDETARDFRATLANGDGPFLRTGDLGFLRSGELFIMSRLKDLIIIRGRNIHPVDVERTAESSHSALRPGASAAFALDRDGTERVVVVQEVYGGSPAPLDEVAAAIRHAVAAAHEVRPFAVVLIKERTIPKTSSGKIQRRKTRDSFLAGSLAVLFESRDPAVREPGLPSRPFPAGNRAAGVPPVDRQVIQDWLLAEIASRQGTDVEQIDARESFVDLGLDSESGVALAGDLAKMLGIPLPETLVWDHPTIEALADHLAGVSPSPHD